MTFKEEMRRYFERYAYQTRHGTEAGADLVLVEALQHIANGCAEHITEDRTRIMDLEAEVTSLRRRVPGVRSKWMKCPRCGRRVRQKRLTDEPWAHMGDAGMCAPESSDS